MFARRRTVISMRPAGCPPISMSKNTTGLDMTTILIQRKRIMRFFCDDFKTVVFPSCQKRTEKVPRHKKTHTHEKTKHTMIFSRAKKKPTCLDDRDADSPLDKDRDTILPGPEE